MVAQIATFSAKKWGKVGKIPYFTNSSTPLFAKTAENQQVIGADNGTLCGGRSAVIIREMSY